VVADRPAGDPAGRVRAGQLAGARPRHGARDPCPARGPAMTALQDVVLVVVALAGTATVTVREPLRQAVVAGFFGLALSVLFFVFGAPTWRCRRSSWRRSPCRS